MDYRNCLDRIHHLDYQIYQNFHLDKQKGFYRAIIQTSACFDWISLVNSVSTLFCTNTKVRLNTLLLRQYMDLYNNLFHIKHKQPSFFLLLFPAVSRSTFLIFTRHSSSVSSEQFPSLFLQHKPIATGGQHVLPPGHSIPAPVSHGFAPRIQSASLPSAPKNTSLPSKFLVEYDIF